MKYLFIFIFLVSASPAFAAVKATINQAIAFEGDPLTLTIETSKNNNVQPDLSPLNKNFILLDSRASSQISIINGSRSFKKTWSIELQPKQKGKIKIPAITVGADITESIEISIESLPPEVTAETNKHIFIETSVGIAGKETYVQQQIPYTVKFFYDSSMQSGEIFSPEIENANIRKLARDRRYQVVRAGKKFTVIEKHFVISPEKSGVLHIPGTKVNGRISLSGGDSPKLRRRMDGTDMLNRFFNDFGKDPFESSPFGRFFDKRSIGPSRPFSISSKAIDVNVLPVPDSFTGSAWLPAEDLVIHDSWRTNPPAFKVGEPVTRTLTLQAKGLASSQIPEINIPKPIGIKVYPEQAETDTPNDGKTIYGVQRTEISYIPNKQGKVTIPEISIDWWDVNEKKQKTFTLPEWGLSVAPGTTGNVTTDAPIEPMSDTIPAKENLTSKHQSPQNPEYRGSKTLLLIGTVLILVFGVLFYQSKRIIKRFSKHKTAGYTKSLDLAKLRADLLQASKNNNNKQSANLLLKLVALLWNNSGIHNLGILASKLSQGSEIIQELDKSLYAANKTQWDGAALHQLIEKGLIQKQPLKAKESTGIAPLYPSLN